jgi:RNA recognition motif-containing protein
MGTRLYVGNLPFTADESQIRDLFSAGGRTVTDVKLVTDRDTGRPRGFGFVEMGSNDEADSAIRDLNGRDFGGRSLTVNEAKERTGGGGGGGRGGFGGGGGGGRRY